MKTCHVRFRGIAATPELLRAVRDGEAVLQRELEADGGCESVLLESTSDRRVRATLRLRLGAAVDLHVYQDGADALGAVRDAFEQALKRAQRRSPPSSGIRSARPGLRRTSATVLRNAGSA